MKNGMHTNNHYSYQSSTTLYASDDNEDATTTSSSTLGDSEQTLLGISGITASVIMLYSESILFQTGCGLPAGPLGLVGAAEGISYLGVVGLVGYSLFTKIRTVGSFFMILLCGVCVAVAVYLLLLVIRKCEECNRVIRLCG